jgi:hypothetical protein
MTKWILVKHEGSIEADRWELPGDLEESQVEEIIRRLVFRTLSEDDIISSSLPEGDTKRYILLDRNDDPAVIHMGENPYYVARLEE